MKPKFVCSLMAVAVLFASAAFAQTGSNPSAALPSAPGTANDPPALTANATGTKVAAINVEQAIFASNEGQRDMDALGKKFEPKSNELKSQNDELEALKKKLNTAADDTKPELQRQVEVKQKALDRAAQDARDAARAMVRDGQAERAAAWISELAGRGVTVDDDAELQGALPPPTGTS